MTRPFSLLPSNRCHRVTQVIGTLGGMALGVLLATTATAAPLYPIPDPDPFYAAPADLAAHRPGDVLDVRALPPLPLFPGATVRQVEFRSTNSRGTPIAATTTILTPLGSRPDAPLLSYQHFINSLGTHCAVSRRLYDGDLNLGITTPILNVALQRGWSIALPDHLGPQFALGAARLGGQITLDGIRAAKRLPELGLANSPVGMVGYSGGGIATSWAAALQPTYAPELRLAGAAIGGVPMNLMTMAEALGPDPHPAFGLAMAVAIGLEREYPDRVPLSAHLNQRGLAVRDAMANSCTNELLAIGANTGARDYASNPSIFDMPGDARAVVEENSLELYPGVPEIPMFEWHSPSDPLIPIGAIVNTDRRWCESGVQLEMQRVQMPEHLTAALIGAPAAMTWIEARIKGEPAPSNC